MCLLCLRQTLCVYVSSHHGRAFRVGSGQSFLEKVSLQGFLSGRTNRQGACGGSHLPELGARHVSFFHFVSLPASLVLSSLSRLQHCVSLKTLVNFEFVSDTAQLPHSFPRIFKKRLAYYGIAQELFNLVLGLAYL